MKSYQRTNTNQLMSDIDELVITTVIPTYRRPAMLRQAINSALGQTWNHVRVCVYDNASGDKTEDVVAMISKTDTRISYYRHRDNIGPTENFNFGVSAVKTPFFSMLCDDDVLLPEFYEHAIDAFREYPDAMFVAMPILHVDDSGWIIGGPGGLSMLKKRYYRAGEAYGSGLFMITGFVFRHKVFEDIGLMNDSAGPATDVAFLRHVKARYPGVDLPYWAGLIRVHPDAASNKMAVHYKMKRSFWRAQARDIENDEHVAISIRSNVYYLIERMYVKGLMLSVPRLSIDGRPDSAMEAITKLKNLGYHIAADLLRLFMLCYKFLPLVSYTLRKIVLQRRVRQGRQLIDINRKYESQRAQFKNLLQCHTDLLYGRLQGNRIDEQAINQE